MTAEDTPPEPDPASALPANDAVDALREELASLEALPVADRVERFEHANAVLAAALAELDEV